MSFEQQNQRKANKQSKETHPVCRLGRSWMPLECLDGSSSRQCPQAREPSGQAPSSVSCRTMSPAFRTPLLFSHSSKAPDCCLSQLIGTPSCPPQTFAVCQPGAVLAISQVVGVGFRGEWIRCWLCHIDLIRLRQRGVLRYLHLDLAKVVNYFTPIASE